MLRKLDMKMTLLAVVLAACGLFLVLGAAKPWSSGAADGFVAVDDEMRRMLETAEAEEKPAQPPKQGEAATASESRAAVQAQGVGQGRQGRYSPQKRRRPVTGRSRREAAAPCRQPADRR
ncbi:hypothetical protein [Paenibacillus mucilaginosus]|uniref:hypothetical protein n=1 Tax=Paenibacillus mucilaginosus TaxID=61624 RepID=UPI00240E6779|nr:hypothetical protein [Paenibacillus mucilaginosus]